MPFTTPAIINTAPLPYAYDDSGKTTGIPQQTIDQQGFLKLLVAQMSSQDPLNPKSDIEMIPQMVSFSTLAQSQSMQKDIAALRTQQSVLQANSFLGHTVEISGPNGIHVLGPVSAVQMVEGTPKLTVNGQNYDLSQVLNIRPAETTTATPETP